MRTIKQLRAAIGTLYAERKTSRSDAVALVGTLGPEAVVAAMLRHLDTLPEGLPAEARTLRLAEIAIELDTLEAEEEHLVTASEEAGAPVQRRADARPEIILAVVA